MVQLNEYTSVLEGYAGTVQGYQVIQYFKDAVNINMRKYNRNEFKKENLLKRIFILFIYFKVRGVGVKRWLDIPMGITCAF